MTQEEILAAIGATCVNHLRLELKDRKFPIFVFIGHTKEKHLHVVSPGQSAASIVNTAKLQEFAAAGQGFEAEDVILRWYVIPEQRLAFEMAYSEKFNVIYFGNIT